MIKGWRNDPAWVAMHEQRMRQRENDRIERIRQARAEELMALGMKQIADRIYAKKPT